MGRYQDEYDEYDEYEHARKEHERARRELIRRRREARRRRQIRRRLKVLSFELIILFAVVFLAVKVFGPGTSVNKPEAKVCDAVIPADVEAKTEEQNADSDIPSWIDVDIIEEGNPSRTGLKLDGVNNIVVHYVGNPGTTAEQNRNFYGQMDSYVSSHFVVGMDGKIIQCIPLDEHSSASNHRNHDTISIEVCHPDETGKFTDDSYEALIKLVDWLLDKYDLTSDDVIRHYDVTGKMCPLYYVEHPDAWEQFKEDL